MPVFRAIVFAGALGGLAVGLLVSLVQHFGTVPLIAQGEVYEKAAPPAAHEHGGAGPAGAGHDHGQAVPAAGDEGWEPADGLERNAYTVLFDVVERIGWAFALAGALVASGRPATWREGLLWGLAGFATFVVAPGIGLPPELPGIPAAPLGARQLWWIATAACTAGGLWLIAFRPTAVAALAAVALMASPHVVGAPILADVHTTVPEALSHRFVTAVALTTFLAWSLTGALTGYLLGRLLPAADEGLAAPRPVPSA